MLQCSMSYFCLAMLHLRNPSDAQHWCNAQRETGRSVGFVPTMGALHRGHESLVDRARSENDVCCASIFVNPLQFEDGQDFNAYPRDLNADLAVLEAHGCDMIFEGTLESFFPEVEDVRRIPMIPAGPFGKGLEELCRPGHLDGVRTIVDRLFRFVGPAKAYFGEKDFQQTLVVMDLAEALGYPEVIVCPTVREPSGLALSSRNTLLSPDEKKEAERIFQSLAAAAKAWSSGMRHAHLLREKMIEQFAGSQLIIEYAAVRNPSAWTADDPPGELSHAQALIAARLGRVRLIDNLQLH